ncbi:MAG: hypothetical protein ABI216_09520 [Devosia sp.]
MNSRSEASLRGSTSAVSRSMSWVAKAWAIGCGGFGREALPPEIRVCDEAEFGAVPDPDIADDAAGVLDDPLIMARVE